ncbi:SPOR domain-containing protein [Bosea sp. (in: a-proteobacteria)]|uniref:SPOR domain-containing protein n=1 Tax=Bosea sp. (in: a-proteobacteria) TaxID=1871050 RepID=UPI00261B073C|nr:SPOR domain-containing protein [Bosea sp. (in: a-proteobacteria)]MCO5093056.1 SPOR domain-containing protein [Bosea sp. (in: a-proteobacteria)]
MSEPARNRFALDLEDLERQLRAAGQAPRPGQQADPLAELTRIVGQDDPLKDIFAERRQGLRHEPSFEVVPHQPAPPAAESGAPPAELRGALDEFEALLRRTEPQRAPPPPAAPRHEYAPDFDLPEPLPPLHPAAPRDLDEGAGFDPAPVVYADEAPAYDYGETQQDEPAPEYGEDDMPDLEPRRSRKGLWAAAAVIAVGLVGVGAAFTWRGGSTSTDGQPPLITADAGPVKVEPVNPGGAEIPNQNKQIYERSPDAPAGQSRVVNNEEQPVDVQQAARSLPPRVVMPGPSSAEATALAAAPGAPERSIVPPEPALTPMPPVPGLGEPRKVRTVSIRPDGTPAQAPVAVDSGQPAATGSAPLRPTAPPAAQPRTAQAPAAPKVQERATTPPAATTPAVPTRLANAAPAAAPQAPATAALRAGTGDFVVQLGAPGSEAEARATFAALQRKYPQQLSGQAPIVRKTELAGGKTVYRLRVGPYSRDEATTMCTQLQAAGGQCFIAKN